MITSHADLILALVGVVAMFTLLPTVWNQYQDKASTVPLTTSLLYFSLLSVVLVVYLSLGFWIAVVPEAITTLLWLVVGYQRWKYGDPVDSG